METIVPANAIKVFMRQGELADGEYFSSNVALIIVDGSIKCPAITFVTISGTAIPAEQVAFARVLINGAWGSHE